MADLHSTVFGSKSQDDISCPRHLYQELSSLIDRLRETVEQLDRDSMSRSGGPSTKLIVQKRRKRKTNRPSRVNIGLFIFPHLNSAMKKKCLLCIKLKTWTTSCCQLVLCSNHKVSF